MNWITTNIRLSEEDYMELKIEAAKRRTSIAALVREKISTNKPSKKVGVNKIMKEINTVAKEVAKQNPELDLTKALIQMRYEQ
ncbi:hypothetical protein A2714_04215 [Candidatus Woesebacteria bacterium RIFCSPHIGHO2_01_FULL_38_9]|uniref:Uncharacterized protein n=2 Tax=Candidatus Woeseibacteriota TaxID=1752722 RepID=A0A1F7XY06_9BACT|nr:MAG: hypothetical protein A2714_04215 [Candidatus Woesebacteria bacterium RIFCSPHIGHO2_01_FULL_38_9]OGM58979.1 MAG: hypothetical protein A3A75_00510 [Candidatus Woesebacteria bacterium RIFCSPLOWO2_01_FULL_39_10]